MGHNTNAYVRNILQHLSVSPSLQLSITKSRSGHVTRPNDLFKTVFQGTLERGRLWRPSEEQLDG
ncbi:hypothetical protein DPMN_054250 [Dreissena polymorpha]|uniref:Uncharacterized protein n=1 Tax=Dreissena polymorpha TaxID=45954 RepID=A0A9D4CP49_DREPO|nr:hypothetical protein DPMN_054250 [Dreissena polymorpha]